VNLRNDGEVKGIGLQILALLNPRLILEPRAAEPLLGVHDGGLKSVLIQDVHVAIEHLDAADRAVVIRGEKEQVVHGRLRMVVKERARTRRASQYTLI
jgi:hypothetical protein